MWRTTVSSIYLQHHGKLFKFSTFHVTLGSKGYQKQLSMAQMDLNNFIVRSLCIVIAEYLKM